MWINFTDGDGIGRTLDSVGTTARRAAIWWGLVHWVSFGTFLAWAAVVGPCIRVLSDFDPCHVHTIMARVQVHSTMAVFIEHVVGVVWAAIVNACDSLSDIKL